MVMFEIIASVILVSLVSLIGILSLLLRKRDLNKLLLTLVSLSAGTLLGGAFIHLIPEIVRKEGFSLMVSLTILAGILIFFILEKVIHHDRCRRDGRSKDKIDAEKKTDNQHCCGLDHAENLHHIGIMNLVGDGLHNFMDGLIIAGSYFVSIPLGITTTIAVILHEVPQELADFGVLLYSGYSKKRALLFNFLSATTAIAGAAVGIILNGEGNSFANLIIPFTAGGFIYIAGTNLIPELHKECRLKDSVIHVITFICGIGLMYGLSFI